MFILQRVVAIYYTDMFTQSGGYILHRVVVMFTQSGGFILHRVVVMFTQSGGFILHRVVVIYYTEWWLCLHRVVVIYYTEWWLCTGVPYWPGWEATGCSEGDPESTQSIQLLSCIWCRVWNRRQGNMLKCFSRSKFGI